MNPRERVRTALARKVPDRVPKRLKFSPVLKQLFNEKTGTDDVEKYFGIELRTVPRGKTRKSTDFSGYFPDLPPGATFTEWGEARVRGSMHHFTRRIHPMEQFTGVRQLEQYPFPDIDAGYRYQGVENTIKTIQDDGYAAIASGGDIFETSWAMRGLDKMLMDFLSDEEFATALLDRVTDMFCSVSEKFAGAGADVIMLGDDIGIQTGMMMSPATWRKWLKPRLARLIQCIKETNPETYVFYHSDGNIEDVIPELIEIGVEVLNPIQPECMDPAELKKQYGDRLAFWGTVGIQHTMPFGTPQEVREEVKLRIETVGKGGGLLIAPTHVLEPEVPWENVVAFIDAVNEFGTY